MCACMHVCAFIYLRLIQAHIEVGLTDRTPLPPTPSYPQPPSSPLPTRVTACLVAFLTACLQFLPVGCGIVSGPSWLRLRLCLYPSIFRSALLRLSPSPAVPYCSEAYISVSLTASAHHRPALPLFKRQRICTVGRPTREHSQRIRTALREPSTPLPLPPPLDRLRAPPLHWVLSAIFQPLF